MDARRSITSEVKDFAVQGNDLKLVATTNSSWWGGAQRRLEPCGPWPSFETPLRGSSSNNGEAVVQGW